ncbi:glycosyltransferase [Alcaligenes sp. Marseille-Q7550]
MSVPFSLLMSAYRGDDPQYCRQALESVCQGSVVPDELVLVLDGPVPAPLREVIESFRERLPLTLVPLPENRGLGPALAAGLPHCRHEWVARFDTDDLCMPDRFERQLAFIEAHPEIDAFSSPILEFELSPQETGLLLKPVPCGMRELARYARWRNPCDHMAVMFRKQRVLQVGSYQDDRYFEDYALWVRLLLDGARLDNMPEPTVWARAGRSMLARRGGRYYARFEYAIQRKFLRWGFINIFEFARNLSIRIPVRLLSDSLRGGIYAGRLRRRV